jgi:hypothetical protein
MKIQPLLLAFGVYEKANKQTGLAQETSGTRVPPVSTCLP